MPRPLRPLALAACGAAALVAGGATAAHADAAQPSHPAGTPGGGGHGAPFGAAVGAVLSSPTVAASGVGHAVRPIADLKLNPLAGTGTDPLTNGVGTQVADFKPVSTTDLTVPLSHSSLSDLLNGTPGRH